MRSIPAIDVVRLGRIGYCSALKLQQSYRKRLLDDADAHNALLLLEHDPVYTIGLRSKEYSAELESRLKSLGADFQRTNRGGLITFHGPGQLVAYPVINLKLFGIGMRTYVQRLEEVVILTCHAALRHWCRDVRTHWCVGRRQQDCGYWLVEHLSPILVLRWQVIVFRTKWKHIKTKWSKIGKQFEYEFIVIDFNIYLIIIHGKCALIGRSSYVR